jgi:hypothetical protein
MRKPLERIWAWPREEKLSPDHVRITSAWSKHPRTIDGGAIEYVLASKLRAAEAALATARADALREAASVKKTPQYEGDWLGMSCAILALIDKEAPDA